MQGWWPQLRLAGAVQALLRQLVPSGPLVWGAPAPGEGFGGAAPCGGRALCSGGAGPGLQPAEGSEQKWLSVPFLNNKNGVSFLSFGASLQVWVWYY